MAVRVLIVDDSGFFRRRLSEILTADPQISIAGMAADGAEAVRMAAELKPDVITMDVEMPVMDGIEAVRRIMRSHPVPILMFSSLTHDGAKATLDALEAGALDFLPKSFDDIALDVEEAKAKLRNRVLALAARGRAGIRPAPVRAPAVSPTAPSAAAVPAARRNGVRIVAIGTSTGGPAALHEVMPRIPAHVPVPILIIQHMPANFTGAFAARLDQQCAIRVKEAADGDRLQAGCAYLAPGGQQTVVEKRGGEVVLRVRESTPDEHYRPSVDTTFRSVAALYRDQALAVVMTGMGSDGREGARDLRGAGSSVWVQDEASCVIYGMPAAVVQAGLANQIVRLDDLGRKIAEAV